MVTSVRLALTHAEKELLYSFRYRVYVEEMSRRQKYADHQLRRIEDPLDATGLNLVAWEGQNVVGCIRVNLAWLGGVDYYCDLLRMSEFVPSYPEGVSVCTRLMVAADRRGSTLAFRLSDASYRLGMQHGVKWNFIDCNDHLVSYFMKHGYAWTHRPVHEEYGEVNAMLLDLSNWLPARENRDRVQLRRSAFQQCSGATVSGVGNVAVEEQRGELG